MQYKEKGYPIDSGMIEASSKLVVSKIFKGNGMRRKRNNISKVLKVRLSFLNGDLARPFEDEKIKLGFAAQSTRF